MSTTRTSRSRTLTRSTPHSPLSNGKSASASITTWTTNTTARTRSTATNSSTKTTHETRAHYPPTRVRRPVPQRTHGANPLRLNTLRDRSTPLCLRVWQPCNHSHLANRLATHVRRRDRLLAPIDWELELPVPVPLLDSKESGILGAQLVRPRNRRRTTHRAFSPKPIREPKTYQPPPGDRTTSGPASVLLARGLRRADSPQSVHGTISLQFCAVMNWERCLGLLVATTTSDGAGPKESA